MHYQIGIFRGHFDQRRLFAYLAITSAFTLLGPFGTYDSLNILWRFIYWALVNASVAIFMTITGDTLFGDNVWEQMARPAKAILAAVIGAIPGAGSVWVLEYFIRNHQVQPVHLWFYVTAVGLAMMIVKYELWRRPAKPYAPFLKRLPPEIGIELISLSMADHYVEVRTTHGSTMLLMRFTDALKELSAYPGHQIHRSHWVADQFVKQLKREGGRSHILIHGGEKLPVSKAYLPAVRKIIERNENHRLAQIGTS